MGTGENTEQRVLDEPVIRTNTTHGKLYYHRNQQFSIVALTNGSGGIVERYAYTAYGEPTILSGSGSAQSFATHQNRYTYAGREWDEKLELYHYRARIYSPVAGRFVSRDPIGYEGGMTHQSHNADQILYPQNDYNSDQETFVIDDPTYNYGGMSLYANYFYLSGTDPTGLEGTATCDTLARSERQRKAAVKMPSMEAISREGRKTGLCKNTMFFPLLLSQSRYLQKLSLCLRQRLRDRMFVYINTCGSWCHSNVARCGRSTMRIGS